jgi:hypothetical protein
MERREIIGNVVSTLLANNLNNSDLSFITADGLGTPTFPTGDLNPFVVVINRGKENEEKILVESRSGNSFSLIQRGYDDVPASSHDAGSPVDHVLDATSIQDMNKTTYDNQVLYWMGV